MHLRIEGLNKSFGSVRVVSDLNFELAEGEILCLLGASGCGKTTTLKMIGGLLEPDSGKIILDGQDITGLPPERRNISIVFQSYALFPNMTVLQNVIYGLKFRGVKKKDAATLGMEYLEMAGLKEYAKARTYEISGGQQQRVALMRALIVKPRVILMDEPLSNLDAKLREKMRVEIKELQQKFGTTMIFVTHDQQEAMSLSSKLAFMNEGRIVQQGSPEELYRSSGDGFVFNFMGGSNKIKTPSGEIERHVRPEDIVFDSQGPIEGVVIESEFFGFYRRYAVETGDGSLSVICLNRQVHHVGERVRLSVRSGV